MDVRVSGHQVDTGEALNGHVTQRLEAMAERYFARAHSAHVTFSRGPHDNRFVCDIIAHIVQGVILKGSSRASEARPAFEEAADKIERQLRRYKHRLKDRQNKSLDEIPVKQFDAGYTIFDAADEVSEVTQEFPLIIAETKVDIPESSVSDAVMMLDLRNTNGLLFKNSATGIYNMIYRRGDGTIGWVEPNSL